MGETRMRAVGSRLAACAAVAAALAVPGAPAAAAPARFVSYSTETQCAAGRILSAAACRSAFARAVSAFEARTQAYPTLALCAKAYGACAPWRPGRGRPEFRPLFEGVDIVDTPGEQSVTPASPVHALRFAALPLAGPVAPPRELTVRGPRKATALHVPVPGRPPAAAPGRSPASGSGPAPVAGSGFTLEDGVLTYPAPARFAPKNLPRRP